MHKKQYFFLLFLIFSLVILSNDGFQRKIINKLNSIKPFKVFFTSRVLDEGEIVISEKGYILYSDDQHIKWVYNDPEYKVWVLKGDKYEFYEKEEEQLTIGMLKDKERIWIWRLMRMKNGNSVSSDENRRVLYINDKETGTGFTIEYNKKFLPIKVFQNDPTGVKIEYIFFNYHFNYNIGDSDFVIKYEKGTDIVEVN